MEFWIEAVSIVFRSSVLRAMEPRGGSRNFLIPILYFKRIEHFHRRIP